LTYPEKITFGEMRSSGVRDVLIDCRGYRWSHHVAISADRWPGHVRLSDIEPDFSAPLAASAAPKCGRSFLAGQNKDRLKRARWCIKSVHASASRLGSGSEGKFCC